MKFYRSDRFEIFMFHDKRDRMHYKSFGTLPPHTGLIFNEVSTDKLTPEEIAFVMEALMRGDG